MTGPWAARLKVQELKKEALRKAPSIRYTKLVSDAYTYVTR
jgi:hypothetical protein